VKKIQGTYEVISNKRIGSKFYHLCIDAKQIVRDVCPGQFVNIKINNGCRPFFRRPFSVYRAKKYLEIFYEVVGKGTKSLSSKKSGEMLNIIGPLGSKFLLPGKDIKQVVMVAGGIGVAPFMFLSDILKKKGRELILLYGGRTKEHVFDMKEFKENGCKVYVSTDDGSVGVKGRVSKLFSKINKDPRSTMIYTCGPRSMMEAVQDFAKKNELPGQLAYEEIMACGLGVCLGCSVKTTAGYKTVCQDGPVFDLNEIMF